MPHISIEMKAKSNNQEAIRKILRSNNADFRGVDRQIDTYFKVNFGRLKLREGKIESYLIHYQKKTGKGQSSQMLFCLKQAQILL